MGILTNTPVQALVLEGQGVKPTIPNPATISPSDPRFNKQSDLMTGQLAFNRTDDIWYYRLGGSIKPLMGGTLTVNDVEAWRSDKIYRAGNTFVSYVNPASGDPQFQSAAIYRCITTTTAGESPESHPAKWELQGTEVDITTEGAIPVGGTAGQVLSKIDGTDYNVEWTDTSSGPATTDDLAEGSTNLYYTDARVSANSDVTANTAKVSFPEAPNNGSQYVRQNLGWTVLDTTQFIGVSQGITRHRSAAFTVGGTSTITWSGRNETLVEGYITIPNDVTFSFGVTSAAELAVLDLDVTGGTWNLTFPVGTGMQSSETRWDAATGVLTLPTGKYKLTIRRTGNGTIGYVYTMECSDAYTFRTV